MEFEEILQAIGRLNIRAEVTAEDYSELSTLKALLEQNAVASCPPARAVSPALQAKLLRCFSALVAAERHDVALRALLFFEPGMDALCEGELLRLGARLLHAFSQHDRSPIMNKVKEIVALRFVPQLVQAARGGGCPEAQELLAVWTQALDRLRMLDEGLTAMALRSFEGGPPLGAAGLEGLMGVICCGCLFAPQACEAALLRSLGSSGAWSPQQRLRALEAYCHVHAAKTFGERKPARTEKTTEAWVWPCRAGGVPPEVARLAAGLPGEGLPLTASADAKAALGHIFGADAHFARMLATRVAAAPAAEQEHKENWRLDEFEEHCADSASRQLARELHSALQRGSHASPQRAIFAADSTDFSCLGQPKGGYLLRLFNAVAAGTQHVTCVERELLAFFLVNGLLPELLAELGGAAAGDLTLLNYRVLEGPPLCAAAAALYE